MGKKIVMICLIALLIPYIATLAWTGRIEKESEPPVIVSGKTVILDRKGEESYLDVEEYLPGVVAKQMPAEYGREALRAQAIVARTYIYRKMDGKSEIKESDLHLEYLEEKQMEELWGSESFVESYRMVEEAVQSTAGMVMMYGENLIEPLFCRASAGMTRNGDEGHPYLVSVNCPDDVKAEGYLSIRYVTKGELAALLNAALGGSVVMEEGVLGSVQVVERDEGGYVNQILIGAKTCAGDEVQRALSLPSPAYTMEEFDGKVRIVCQGIGHGYGLSQYEAKCKAAAGWTAEEILAYFYKNIVLVSTQ